MLLLLLFLGSECCKFEKWPADIAQKMTLFRCWMSYEWVWRSSVPPVVEINKHKILTMLESLNYSFRNPKNIIWVIYRIKQLRNYKKTMRSSKDPSLVNNVDDLGLVYWGLNINHTSFINKSVIDPSWRKCIYNLFTVFSVTATLFAVAFSRLEMLTWMQFVPDKIIWYLVPQYVSNHYTLQFMRTPGDVQIF